ncbi:MAG TPA: PAS domain-containing sensor histidine kinase [Polyangia bacterium]|nr:PAS domain-containing sensor histidine kinase [Polyangia bacterium]
MATPSLHLGGNDQLAETLDRMSDGFISYDRAFRIIYLNGVAAAYFGLPVARMVGKIIWDLFPEASDSPTAEQYRRAAVGSEPVEFEMRSPITNRWVVQRLYPSASGLTVYFRDVTEHRQAEETLRESQARYQSLFDHCLDGVLLTAPTGETLAANPAACRMLGRSEEELCRVGRTGIVDAEDPRMIAFLAERARNGAARTELDMIRGDGSTIPVEVSSALFTDREGQPRSSLSFHDLAERKRSEQAMKLIVDAGVELSRSLERGEILRRLTALVVPRVADVCLVDLFDGERLRRVATRRRDAEGRRVAGAEPGWDREQAGARRVLETAAPELVSPAGADDDGLAALGVRSGFRVPLRVAGKPIGVLSLFVVDERRAFAGGDLPTFEALADRAALALENARLYQIAVDAKRVRDEVLTTVSHDLRNSLNAIGFIATELARQGGSPLATQIRSAATLADRLLADLGAMFAIESGALVLGRFMEPIDSIVNEVADLFRPLADARAIRLRAVSERKGLTAFVDRHRMVQAVSNVVANAVEISDDGGQVDLAVKQVGDDVELAVSDTGPGIAPGEVARLFDRSGWRRDGRRRASVGLGLLISKQYVEAHGGRIRVQSQLGSGSTFTIAIPMRPNGGEPVPVRRAKSGPHSSPS